MIARIARHEWHRQRAGLTFWLLLAAGQMTVAWLAFAQLEAFADIAPRLKAGGATLGATDLVVMPTFNSLLLVLLLGTPLLAMGSIAGEAHSGRLALWLASPLSASRIIVGKVLGLWLGLLPLVASASVTLAALGIGVALDPARLALAVAAMLIVSLWLAAVTVWLSSLFDRPAAALTASYAVLLFLWLLDTFSGDATSWRTWALLPHVQPMLRGLLRAQDLTYFAATALTALLLTMRGLDRRRGRA
ncbi:MAG: ABC transporter permease subunit [Chromatiaceae bacterium]|nr:ABC transporter permease subunit [Gammaproteobacteria bacterium]MCP5300099.1 ABC transporter permease subunit [Chromatiaceae bacterium]MCP5422171.1 ABC transporter permease subunit [Chromatiaceae bacterium]